MSGHSKWKNIMHKKEKTDAQRAKVFTKIGREISLAVREGGPDPVSNAALKDLIAKAKANNVPNDNIERVIKKAAGGNEGANYEVLTYEGYGPSGIAVYLRCVTDNRNRTAGDLRHYFDKCGGNLGQTGSVNWMFEKKGVIIIDGEEATLGAYTIDGYNYFKLRDLGAALGFEVTWDKEARMIGINTSAAEEVVIEETVIEETKTPLPAPCGQAQSTGSGRSLSCSPYYPSSSSRL